MTRIIDLTPDKGTYLPEEVVRIDVAVDTASPAVLTMSISHFDQTLHHAKHRIDQPGSHDITFEWQPPNQAPKGYGVDIELVDDKDRKASASTAFDVLTTWTDFPRYGFLSDFEETGDDPRHLLKELTRFHINGLQFYDWMYRHDDPVPPTPEFIDPLGRKLSRDRIDALVAEAHRRGMAAMAYLAVYAASAEYWSDHPKGALYNSDGQPISFGEDFLGLMDPSRGSHWSRHLLDRSTEVLEAMGFDGIHIDQYGEPKTGFDATGKEVDIPQAFADFISDLKSRHREQPTTFNAVKNWPIESLLHAPIDFVYIELWPDMPTYDEVGSVVAEAHRDSDEKAVVIAIYIPSERDTNVKLANAWIGAHGGSRIEIGEGARLLTDPYFPLHEPIGPGLYSWLRRIADIRVRYGDVLAGSSSAVDGVVEVPEGVVATTRRWADWTAVNLINMRGIEGARWDENHPDPERIDHGLMTIESDNPVSGVWSVSPDTDVAVLGPLVWEQADGKVVVHLPPITIWTVVMMKVAPHEMGQP